MGAYLGELKRWKLWLGQAPWEERMLIRAFVPPHLINKKEKTNLIILSEYYFIVVVNNQGYLRMDLFRFSDHELNQ